MNNIGTWLGLNPTAEDISKNIDKITDLSGKLETRDNMTEWTTSLVTQITEQSKKKSKL